MKVMVENFKGNIVKWIEVSDSGVLFNTKDILDVLGVVERPENSELSDSCIDLARAILISSEIREDFTDWLVDRFSGYDNEVFLRPKCLDDEWSSIL